MICTELCGLGHALMRSEAIVMSEDKFLSWTKSQTGGGAAGAGARRPPSGKALFVSNGCDGCHTFKPAGAKGTVGPDLDKLPDFARRAGKPLEQFIRESIVNPDAYVEPGYPKGVMPSTFASLPPAQIDALVKYLQRGRSERRGHRLPRARGAGRAPAARRAAARLPPAARSGLAARALDDPALLRDRRRASRCSSAALEGWHPIWPGSIITTVELTTVPLGFLVGIGGFDYWMRYATGAPTQPEDHSGHGARSWRDYFRINTDHKVIGIQYLVTTIVFFVIAGLLAMFMRAELARPGMQFVDNQTFNGLFSVHAALMIFLFVIPAFAGIGNYVIPLMIGAPDMAFPRLNALSFWLLPIAGIMMVSSFLVPGGAVRGRLDELRAALGPPAARQHLLLRWPSSGPARARS